MISYNEYLMKKTDVIDFLGGVCNTAELLGITHPSVSGWTEIIPEGAALKLEKLTNGKLKYDASLYPKGRRRAKHAA